jgi:hypothetical protein
MDLARPLSLLGYELALSLAAWAIAHVTVVVKLARGDGGTRGWQRWAQAGLALAVPPLAPWWGWRAGMKRTTRTWGAALALYAIGAATAIALTGR